MIELEDLVREMKVLGASDLVIIKEYFIRNRIIDTGINLLTELSKEQTRLLYNTIRTHDNMAIFNAVMLNNKVDKKDGNKLVLFANKFVFIQDLNEQDIKDIKKIYSKYKELPICPTWFRACLKKYGVIKEPMTDEEKQLIENIQSSRYL